MITLVNQGSSVNILCWKTSKQMRIAKEEMKLYDDHVIGFSSERVGIWGYIKLYTTFGEGEASKTIKIWYLVDANTSYNILLGRPFINRLRAIVSTPHLVMKFSSASRDILTVHVDQEVARECYAASLRMKPTNQDDDYNRSPRQRSSRGRMSPWREAQLDRREHIIALVDLDPWIVKSKLELWRTYVKYLSLTKNTPPV